MALDGSLYDSFTGEPVNRLLRPASLEHALVSYPLFILRMKQGALIISSAAPVESPPVITASVTGRPEERWVMYLSDYRKCVSVSSKVDSFLFRTESQGSVLERIAAYLRVEFSPPGG